jgi:predicted enzyme related to lactoylglutathione lyase
MAEVRHIAFTVYPVIDLARARRFYEDGLGLRLSHDFQGHWIEYEIAGGVFAISDMLPDGKPSATDGGSIAFEVDDVDAVMQRLVAAGGRAPGPAFDTPVCRMGLVLDPEGNALIIHKVTG